MKKSKIILIIIITIIFSISIIYLKKYKNEIKSKNNKNIIIGSWNYNEYGGKYIFNDDYTYYQYSNASMTNNYCHGTYNYSSGAKYNGIIIEEDKNFIYYTLNLEETDCMINGFKNYNQNHKTMTFSTNKNDENELIMMNNESKKIFKLKKVNSK